jgi:VWFA-related protein
MKASVPGCPKWHGFRHPSPAGAGTMNEASRMRFSARRQKRGTGVMKTMIFILVASWMLLMPSPAQDEEEPIREKVETINVEVPVRVYADGHAVSDLKKEDFVLCEDGKAQTINGFFLSRRKIVPSPEATVDAKNAFPSRYFVLAFRVHDFNAALREGLAHLFENVLRPDDQLLVFINNRTRMVVRLLEKERIRTEIEEDLRNQCHVARNNMVANLKQVEDEGNQIRMKLKDPSMLSSTRPSQIAFFLEKYIETWSAYKRKYLNQEVETYYNFAKHLAKIRKEKWVINFYQMELFPQLSVNKELRRTLEQHIESFKASDIAENIAGANTLSRVLQEIDQKMKMDSDFSAKEISKLFYKVNASFHSIFIKSQVDALSENVEYRQMATRIEENLRELTEKTGGNLVVSNDIVSSLNTISETEDTLYMLTYAPANPKKIGKIKIKVDKGKYDVLYDDNQRADYIAAFLKRKELENPAVAFKELSFADRKLTAVLTRFRMRAVNGKSCGNLAVRIKVVSSSGQTVFDNSRNLEAMRDPLSISLGFDFLPSGKYDVVVEVQDLLGGKSSTDFLQPVID